MNFPATAPCTYVRFVFSKTPLYGKTAEYYCCILEREIKPSEIRKLFDCWQKWFHGIALLRTATWVRGNVGNYTF